eukprot:TRINITY_DN3212_c0_g3_i1.p1 TRINITY_DN3212_c0_g3~~TRINITY_DN3212_c0_g3_i1.p1  ORF type:complete len:408 (+),score=84.21 TRINITY_DN3212_c0_g3_i1:182-1405(+)
MASNVSMEDRFIGCLIGGACGDALGARVEFDAAEEIFHHFGPSGIRDFVETYGIHGAFTDDTQMTLFTAEGLLSAVLSFRSSNPDPKTFQAEDAVPALHQAYLRWLDSQGEVSRSPLFAEAKTQGLLVAQPGLRSRRGPGATCRMSLKSGAVGSYDNKINDSKGCGGIMRVAPCGLIVVSAFPFLSSDDQAELAFKLGCVSAAITHTHPSGWLSSGFQAAVIARILSGDTLEIAIDKTTLLLKEEESNDETLEKVVEAQTLAAEFKNGTEVADSSAKQTLVLKHIEQLGRGFVGEEALGIALYCALICSDDVENAICYSVNHGGDSDSTGAIVGNIMGALYGEDAVPSRWRDAVEMADLIREVGRDLLSVGLRGEKKYPPAITIRNGEEYYKNRSNLVLPPFRLPSY